MQLNQASRILQVYGPFELNELVFRSMKLTEELGRPSTGVIELLSNDHEYATEDLLGESISVRMVRGKDQERWFHGYITQAQYTGSVGPRALYRVRVGTWLSLLARSVDCRIYQDMSAPEIITELFQRRELGRFRSEIMRPYPTRTYCVQYRESDLNFVLRLMEEEGIYFTIEHDDEGHEVVLHDESSRHPAMRGHDIRYSEPEEGTTPIEQFVTSWRDGHRLHTAQYAIDAYDFEVPQKTLLVRSAVVRTTDSLDSSEIYDPLQRYTVHEEGEHYSRVRSEELSSRQHSSVGTTNCSDFAPGTTFTMIDHPREDQNRSFLVTRCEYSLKSDDYTSAKGIRAVTGPDLFACRFEVIHAESPYRSRQRTPKPRVQGVQTAVVVGPEGREIFTDEHGRVKVWFRWDRHNGMDETSSCWIRVAQPWASRGFGAVFLPRIGDEVLVEFIDGDPDRPIVTGTVYNGARRTPYELPTNQTVSGIRTRTSTEGTSKTCNEIRFEDKAGSEELFMKAEKDHIVIVNNDEARQVGNDKFEDIQNDRRLYIGNDRATEVVGEDNLLVGKDIRVITENGGITLVAETEIKLQVGEAAIYLNADGTIVLDGTDVVINGSNAFAYTASSIVGEATEAHHFKGATVNHNTD